MKGGWFYLITNRRNGILYTGVTSNLPRRAFEHRQGLIEGFTKRFGLKMLVYCEHYDDIRLAIQREKTSSIGRERGKFGSSTRKIPSGTTCTTR
jgi:putative endonuclease